MVRIIAISLLTLALSFNAAYADDTITANQLESLVTAVANLASGGTTTVTTNINNMDISYTVTKDALGNITATGPANAPIQTIAISTGSSGTAASVPLAATVITSGGSITSFNIATNASGQITGVTSTSDTVSTVAKTTGTTTQTTTTAVSGITVTDTITTTTGGGGSTTGTVSITFAPGTSPATSTVISPH